MSDSSEAAAKYPPVIPINAPPSPSTRRKLVDEFCRLKEESADYERRQKYLQDQILSWHPQFATEPFAKAEEHGDQYILKISPQTKQTKVVRIPALYKFLRIKAFLAFVERCRPTLKALEESIPEESDRQQFIQESQTGYRRFEVVKKFQEAA